MAKRQTTKRKTRTRESKHERMMRFLRWHHARLEHGQLRLVFLPEHDRFSAIRRDGKFLLVQVDAWTTARVAC